MDRTKSEAADRNLEELEEYLLGQETFIAAIEEQLNTLKRAVDDLRDSFEGAEEIEGDATEEEELPSCDDLASSTLPDNGTLEEPGELLAEAEATVTVAANCVSGIIGKYSCQCWQCLGVSKDKEGADWGPVAEEVRSIFRRLTRLA